MVFVGSLFFLRWVFVKSLVFLRWVFVGSLVFLHWVFVGSFFVCWVFVCLFVCLKILFVNRNLLQLCNDFVCCHQANFFLERDRSCIITGLSSPVEPY